MKIHESYESFALGHICACIISVSFIITFFVQTVSRFIIIIFDSFFLLFPSHRMRAIRSDHPVNRPSLQIAPTGAWWKQWKESSQWWEGWIWYYTKLPNDRDRGYHIPMIGIIWGYRISYTNFVLFPWFELSFELSLLQRDDGKWQADPYDLWRSEVAPGCWKFCVFHGNVSGWKSIGMVRWWCGGFVWKALGSSTGVVVELALSSIIRYNSEVWCGINLQWGFDVISLDASDIPKS